VQLWAGTPYEYSRAAGRLVFTAGACPLDTEGNVVPTGDFRGQAKQAVDNLLEALADGGAGADSLLKTTIYVATSERADLVEVWETVADRLGRAPSTLLGVAVLGYPGQLVEIEAVAVRREPD
jgi:enamine deaminase RidA (YjgF/YER057c/UK114 family)